MWDYRNRCSGRSAALVRATVLGVVAAFPLTPCAASGQEPERTDVAGVVIDVDSQRGIGDVILRVLGTPVSAASDEQGRFLLRGVPSGTWTLRVDHLRYGTHRHQIAVEGGGSVSLQIRLDEEAIELAPLVVEAESSQTRAQLARGSSFWEVTRAEIDRAMGTSRHMGDLIRQTVPGIKLRQASNLSQSDICLEFRAAASLSIVNSRPCNHPQVYLDGVAVSNPQYLYGSVGLHNLERIEVIPPGEAGARYGTGSLYGVLLLETRRPGNERAVGERAAPVFVPTRRGPITFDWSQEPAGHKTGRTVLGALLGNAAGLGLGVALARQCISVDSQSEIQTSCGTGTNIGVGALAFALPAVGSALGARWGGDSDMSVGRMVPALLGASMMLFPGYAFTLTSTGDVEAVNRVGQTFLALGVPLAVTMADRLFRRLK